MNYEKILIIIGLWELTKHALKKIWKVFSNTVQNKEDE
mgnify:CR=1 FL=1